MAPTTTLMKPFSLTYVRCGPTHSCVAPAARRARLSHQIARMTGDFPPLTDRYPEDDFVGTLMAFASLVPISIIVATLGAFLARRELWDLLTLAGILVNEMVAQTLKRVFEQPRPPSCAAVDFCHTYGMPSSHAQLAWFAATLSLARLLRCRRANPGARFDPISVACAFASAPLAAAVAASRVHLGYHSIEQVIAGSLAGCLVGAMWHVLTCRVAAAARGVLSETARGGGVFGAAARLAAMVDSSLVADPLAAGRRALGGVAPEGEEGARMRTRKRR